AEGDQVKVERPGFVQSLFWLPTKLRLQRLKFSEQAIRSFVDSRQQADDGVDKQRRTWRTIHRRALPKRRAQRREIGQRPQPFHCLAHASFGVAKIRAKGDEREPG